MPLESLASKLEALKSDRVSNIEDLTLVNGTASAPRPHIRLDRKIVEKLQEAIPIEGYFGACMFATEEFYDAGKYREFYKIETYCEIVKNKIDNTYSCNWGRSNKKLIRKEKLNTSLDQEVMI